MKQKYVLVFDIGSSKLRAMVAGRGINNTFAVKGYNETTYDGFFEGEFLCKEKLRDVFEDVLKEFEPYLKKINKVFIGVPAEFSSVMPASVAISLGEKRKIKKQDVESLFYMASEKAKNSEVEVVSVSPISFDVDGGLTLDPVGDFGLNISANLSIVYANKAFIDLFNNIASSLGFNYVEYISEPLAQANFVLPSEKKEDLSLLIDCGDITTSIALVKGNGLSALTSFSRGGGFITNDLSEAFELSIADAEKLKRQVVLSVKGGASDFYELPTQGGRVERFLLGSVNEVVSYRIEELAEVINQCLQTYSDQHLAYLPIYLTGAGVAKLKGGRDYLAKCLGRNIAYGVPPLPGKDKPEHASIYSLVHSALASEFENS
ncbi:MAG: hypothetical protein J6A28_04440 [Clostridia bacterium]|nr:hypothetical protein [Clostridia bacterium]